MKGIDEYTFKARVQPVMLAALPIAALLVAWVPNASFISGGVAGGIGAAAGAALVAQLGRDRGRQKQPELWERWGGPPTTRLLRFRDSSNRVVLDRRRANLQRVTGRVLPSEDEEAEDPAGADQAYEAAVGFLREATRDRSRFPLVFAENVNYGFRRNLWGLKPFGLSVATLAALVSWALFMTSASPLAEESWIEGVISSPDGATTTRLVASVLNTGAIAVWLFLITPEWIRTAAEAYAERLLSAVDAIDVEGH